MKVLRFPSGEAHARYGSVSDLQRDVLADLNQLVDVVRDLVARIDELERTTAQEAP